MRGETDSDKHILSRKYRLYPSSSSITYIKTAIKHTMSYGDERWTMKRQDERLVNETETRMLRWILGVRLRDHIRNEEIRRAATSHRLQYT